MCKFSDGEVLEETHYYPFGLAMDGPWLNDLTARDNRYKFNGIERIPDFGLNMDLAPFRSYDPAIGRWWQADPIAKAWESPYAAMFNSPLNWADGMGDNPSSPGIQGPRAVAQDSTPRTVWNFLTIPKLQYTDEDRIPVLGTQQFTTKITINTGVELWNGAVGLAYGVTHPKQAWKGIERAAGYLWNSSLDQKLTDLGDVAYNSPETIVSAFVPIGAATKLGKLGKLGTFVRKAAQASPVAAKVVAKGMDIALGVSEHLDDFAKLVKGKTWHHWGTDSFQSQFLEVINNPANRIHFNLDKIGRTGVWSAVQEGSRGLNGMTRVTSWELYQIYSNPAVLKRTIFYEGGKRAPNPFE